MKLIRELGPLEAETFGVQYAVQVSGSPFELLPSVDCIMGFPVKSFVHDANHNGSPATRISFVNRENFTDSPSFGRLVIVNTAVLEWTRLFDDGIAYQAFLRDLGSGIPFGFKQVLARQLTLGDTVYVPAGGGPYKYHSVGEFQITEVHMVSDPVLGIRVIFRGEDPQIESFSPDELVYVG